MHAQSFVSPLKARRVSGRSAFAVKVANAGADDKIVTARSGRRRSSGIGQSHHEVTSAGTARRKPIIRAEERSLNRALLRDLWLWQLPHSLSARRSLRWKGLLETMQRARVLP